MLRSAEWVELVGKATEWDLRFAVPEVCLLEAVDVVRRKWKAQRNEIAKLPIGEFGLADSQQEWLRAIDSKIDGYEAALRARLSEINAEIVPIPDSIDVLDLVRRAIDRRKPFPEGEGKKDGFRDTLIWRTVVESIAASNDDCEVWLISTNHNDFGDKSAAENDEACPYPLHPHLLDDLQTDNVAVRVSYVRTIGRLAQQLASTYDGLPEEERDSLTADLDFDEFHSELRSLLDQLQLNPAASALPVRTLIGTIQSIGDTLNKPVLVDVALRGAASWTAQFSQTISVTVDITLANGDTSVIDKTLSVAGRLLASADHGSVKEILITSVEARNDDPMRRAWSRRARLGLDPEVAQGITGDFRSGIDPEVINRIAGVSNFGIDPEVINRIAGVSNFGIDPEVINRIAGVSNFGIDPEVINRIAGVSNLGIDPEVPDTEFGDTEDPEPTDES